MAGAEMKGNLASGQFINIQKMHIARMLSDEAGSVATYERPVSLGKILRKVDIKPNTSQAELYADGQSIDTAACVASFDLTFDTAALPLEYVSYLFGHKLENGVMKAGKDDVPPYFAVLFQSDKRNGKVRYTKFYKVQFVEPSESGSSKETNIQYNTPTITGKAIYRLSDGLSYAKADEESAGFAAGETWYDEV